jgi:hypothetical protein
LGIPYAGHSLYADYDYSAAVSDENGTIWMGNGYIPNAPRTVNANWGTFIGSFAPQ